MKFLLTAVHAKYIHTGLAVYSLRSYAGEELRKHIEVAEYTINQQTEDILADIYRRRPDAVGFSCYIWNFPMVKKLVREIYKLLPDIPIWLGGPEVSYAVRQGTGGGLSDYIEWGDILKSHPEVTGIMAGEGEETFRELLREYVKEEESFRQAQPVSGEERHDNSDSAGLRKALRGLPLQITGVVTRDGFFGYREPLDMDALPFYYDDLEEAEEERSGHKIIYYESSRGCPFRCSYCLSSIEKQVRLRSAKKVKRELQYFLDKRVKQVKFIDRTFNCNREHAFTIWRFLAEHDNGVTNFHFEISAELLTKEELSLFSRMRPGLIQLEIGVQTTNRETLQAIHRKADLKNLKLTVLSVYKLRNIHQHLDLIAGLPYEDLKSFRKSFNDVYGMRPDQLQLGFLKVLKGSEMYERAGEYGIAYQSEPPYEVLYTKWLAYEDVLELKKVERMLELFYNSRQFCHTLKTLEKLFETPYDMYLALAEFYEENGFFINDPARGSRYEIVLKFVENYLQEQNPGRDSAHSQNFVLKTVDMFRELLTFDYYLRENAKSRPVFAKDIRCRYQEITAFYKKEKESPALLAAYAAKGYDSRQMMRMTHMDIFCYPVWDEAWFNEIELGEPGAKKAELEKTTSEEEQFVLFDYERRSPLTNEAWYAVIKK